MSDKQKIRETLSKLFKTPILTLTGEVVAVDSTKYTCDVKPDEDGPEIFDVRLRSLIDEQDTGFIPIPKVGSNVLIGSISNDEDQFFVVGFSELERIEIRGEFLEKVMNLSNDSGVTMDYNGGQFTLLLDPNKLKIDSVKNILVNCDGTIIFNGGSNLGLPKTPELVARLNTIENMVNNLILSYNVHTHTIPIPPPITFPAVLTPTVIPDIENPKIKQ